MQDALVKVLDIENSTIVRQSDIVSEMPIENVRNNKYMLLSEFFHDKVDLDKELTKEEAKIYHKTIRAKVDKHDSSFIRNLVDKIHPNILVCPCGGGPLCHGRILKITASKLYDLEMLAKDMGLEDMVWWRTSKIY